MKSILSDIFANNNSDCSTLNTESTSRQSPTIRQAILDACSAQNINATEYFVEKVYQIYEMLNIRPGIMIIGESFAGKTTAYRILAKALALLQQQNTTEMNETHPLCTITNPKSVTIGRLYGVFDSNTHEWRDGILAINFKHFINANVERRKWLIFDGPVDCVWMENINSVLDDNRKLCLVSGDIFHLEKNMNLLFEAMELRDASPAIVKKLIYFLWFYIVEVVFHSIKSIESVSEMCILSILFLDFTMRYYLYVIICNGLATIARIMESQITTHFRGCEQARNHQFIYEILSDSFVFYTKLR